MIYIGSDHRGFKLKEKLKVYLQERGYQITDMGTDSEAAVDYPLIAAEVGKRVLEDHNNRGILLCGSAVGICMAVNKIRGIRAGAAWSVKIASAARNDDNINVLCMAADEVSEEEMTKMAQVFLDTSFGGEERRKRRLAQIEEIEKNN